VIQIFPFKFCVSDLTSVSTMCCLISIEFHLGIMDTEVVVTIVLPSPPPCASGALVPGVQPEPTQADKKFHNSDYTSGALKL